MFVCVYVFELDTLFIGVFVVVSYSSISLGVSTFLLCSLVFGPLQCVFVMSRTCNNVEFDSSLSSKPRGCPSIKHNAGQTEQSGVSFSFSLHLTVSQQRDCIITFLLKRQ